MIFKFGFFASRYVVYSMVIVIDLAWLGGMLMSTRRDPREPGSQIIDGSSQDGSRPSSTSIMFCWWGQILRCMYWAQNSANVPTCIWRESGSATTRRIASTWWAQSLSVRR